MEEEIETPVAEETLETPEAPEAPVEQEQPAEEAATEPEVESAATEPEKPAEQPKEPEAVKPSPRRQIVLEKDDLDNEFDDALKAIDEDETLSTGQKAAQKLDLKTKQEERTTRRRQQAESEQERLWSGEAARYGVDAATAEQAWADAAKEVVQELGAFDQGAATIIYRRKMAAAKTTAKPTQDPPARQQRQSVNTPPNLPRGASGRQTATQDNRTVMEKVHSGDKATLKEIAEINRAWAE